VHDLQTDFVADKRLEMAAKYIMLKAAQVEGCGGHLTGGNNVMLV